jgi:ketosteroid isomerase-like protein
MTKTNLEIAKSYIALFDNPQAEPEQFKTFLAPDVVYEEMPNLLSPEGSTRNRDEMLAGIVQGKDLLSEQDYRIHRAVGEKDVVALEVQWQGKLAVGFGDVAAGTVLRARIAMFITFAAGQIVHQRNYDAYDPIS